MPTIVKKEQLIFWIVALSSFTFLTTCSIIYFSEAQTCTMRDFNPSDPIEVTYKDFTQDSACQKSLAMCRYFSKFPGQCRVEK